MNCPSCNFGLEPSVDFNNADSMFHGTYVCFRHHYWTKEYLMGVHNMVFKEVKAGGTPVDWSKTPSIEGTYKGKEEAKYGYSYLIETADKKILLVWGSKFLDRLMAKVEVGQKIKIDMTGEATSDQGRKYRTFKLFKDE